MTFSVSQAGTGALLAVAVAVGVGGRCTVLDTLDPMIVKADESEEPYL